MFLLAGHSDRSRFLGCCTVRRRRLIWSMRLSRRRRVRRGRVQDRGMPAAYQLHVS
jgi:hypothetical protein